MIGLAVIAGVSLGACQAHTAASAATVIDAQPTDDQAAAELQEHHRHHHLGGAMQFIAMSLDTLGADDAKRPQIEKLQGELYSCMAPTGQIERNLLLTFADGIAAGVIDRVKVDADLAQLNTAAAAVYGCSIDALNDLHAILSPTERETLVDKVQAHWEVWRQINHESETRGHRAYGRLGELDRELNLSADQVEKMSEALHIALAEVTGKFDPKNVEAYLQAFSRDFVGTSFNANQLAVNPNAYLAFQGSTRMAIFYETVTPLLTPEQRVKLSVHLREHASQQPLSISAK